MSERIDIGPSLIQRLKRGVEAVWNVSGRRLASGSEYGPPLLRLIPNPAHDPDGYDRHWIQREEGEMFTKAGIFLTRKDLSAEVLDWVRKRYPGSYSTQAIRLHDIVHGWRIDNQIEARKNPQGWVDLLGGEDWKQYVPTTDFNKEA